MAKDNCVLCGVETPYDFETHIDMRIGYIEGAGQLCDKCYNGETKTNNMLDALEQRIADLLKSNGATDTQIEMYLDDVFAFADREVYEAMDDEDILTDFDEWLEK